VKNNSRTEHLGATLLLLLIYIFPAFASVIFSITHTEPLFLCKFSWHWCVRKRYSKGPINHYQFDNFLQSKETSEVVRYLLSVGNLDMKHDTSFHSSLSWIIIIISQLVSLRCDQSILLAFRYLKLLIWYMLELCFFTWMWRLIDVVGLILVLFSDVDALDLANRNLHYCYNDTLELYWVRINISLPHKVVSY